MIRRRRRGCSIAHTFVVVAVLFASIATFAVAAYQATHDAPDATTFRTASTAEDGTSTSTISGTSTGTIRNLRGTIKDGDDEFFDHEEGHYHDQDNEIDEKYVAVEELDAEMEAGEAAGQLAASRPTEVKVEEHANHPPPTKIEMEDGSWTEGKVGQLDGESSCTGPNGRTYPIGESFMDAEGCNRCTCGESGMVMCTERACVHHKEEDVTDHKHDDEMEISEKDIVDLPPPIDLDDRVRFNITLPTVEYSYEVAESGVAKEAVVNDMMDAGGNEGVINDATMPDSSAISSNNKEQAAAATAAANATAATAVAVAVAEDDSTGRAVKTIRIKAQRKRLQRSKRKWRKLNRLDYSFQYREKSGLYTVKVLDGVGQNANPITMEDIFQLISTALRQGSNLKKFKATYDPRSFYPSFFSATYFDEQQQANVNTQFRISGLQSPPQSPQGYAKTERLKAQARWLSKKVKGYTYNVTASNAEPSSECARPQLRTVINDKIQAPVLFADNVIEIVPEECGPFLTVNEMLDAIGADLELGYEVDAIYSKRIGFPMSIKVVEDPEGSSGVAKRGENGLFQKSEPTRTTNIRQFVRLRKGKCPANQPQDGDKCRVAGLGCPFGVSECCSKQFVATICRCESATKKYKCSLTDCPALCPPA